MIPEELQRELDDFNVKHKKHCEDRMQALFDEFKEYGDFVKSATSEVEKKGFVILHRDRWEYFKGRMKEMDDLVGKMHLGLGEQCVKCRGWISDRLEGKCIGCMKDG